MHGEVTNHLLQDLKYKRRNRYNDIFVYQSTRVKLKLGVANSANPVADYINACYVNSPFEKAGSHGSKVTGDRKIIAAQGPLNKTSNDFW